MRWLLLLVCLPVAACSLELYLTFHSGESARLADWQARHYDLRTKDEMLAALKQEGKNPTLSLVPRFLLDEPEYGAQLPLFPLGGISRRLTIFCNETGQWSLYESDEHGFNNPPGLYAPGIDLLLIGESFAQGACVPPQDSVQALLRRSYPRTLSLGMDGSGEVTTLASLMEYGPFLRPKRVVWIYVENTLGRANRELKNPILRQYFMQDAFRQNLLERQPQIDTFWQRYLDAKLKMHAPEHRRPGFHLAQFLRLQYLRDYYQALRYGIGEKMSKGNEDADGRRFETILRKADALTRSWGGTFYFAYLATPYIGQDKAASDHERIVRLARSLNLHVIDSYSLMEAQNPYAINAYDGRGHYNARGYRLFSDLLQHQLQ